MNIDALTTQEPPEENSVSTPFPKAWWGKIIYGLFVVGMPMVAFWATGLFKPEWQSGDFSDYIILLLFPEASLLFFILLAYCIICYCLLLVDSTRYSEMYVVRFGVYTAVILALQYSVLAGLFLYNNSWESLYLVTLWILPVFVPKIYRFVVGKLGSKTVNTALLILVTAIFLISAVLMRSPLSPLIFVLVALTIAAPFWSFLLALQASIWLFKNHERKLTGPRGLGIAAWLAGYIAAWRFDILKMYELYAALPPEPPPDCYIATAAAQGHPQFVGSWLVYTADGESMRVNRQLQILKCAELAWMAVQPRSHKTVRRIYDVLGKPLAKRIRNPFLADIAYLMLKPGDWLAWRILRMIIPEIDLISKKMYLR